MVHQEAIYPVTNKKQWRAAKSYARNAPNPAGIRAAADRIAKQRGWKEYGGYLDEYGLGGWLKDNIQGVVGGAKTLGGGLMTILSGGALAPLGLPMMAGGLSEIAGEVAGDVQTKRQEDAYSQQQSTIQGMQQKANQEQYLSGLTGSENPYTPTFPMGGALGHSQAEIEGGEVIQFPNGNMDRPQGPTHAQGGMDITAPEDTRIFSDRLQYEKGVTYAAKADAIRKEIEKYKKLLK